METLHWDVDYSISRFEYTKGYSDSVTVIREGYSQYNVQRKKNNRTNNDLQRTPQKTKDRVTRTPLKPGMNSDDPEG